MDPFQDMQPFIVRANIMNFPFNEELDLRKSGFLLKPSRIPWYLKIKTDSTGEIAFIILAPNWEFAVNLAQEGILRFVSELLTYATYQPVFFNNIRIEDKDHVFICEWNRLVGLPTQEPPRIRPERTLDFLNEGINKITKSGIYFGSPRLIESLYWINQIIISPFVIDEFKFTMLWLALETLVTADEECSKETVLLSRNDFKSLKTSVGDWAKTNRIKEETTRILMNRLNCVNRLPTSERIIFFCNAHNIKINESTIAAINTARNVIQHVPWKTPRDLRSQYLQLQLLIENCICGVIGLNPEDYLVPDRMP